MNDKDYDGLYGDGLSRTSLSPNAGPFSRRGRSHLRTCMMVASVAMIVVSATVIFHTGKEGAAHRDIPGGISIPGPPFFVIGFTYDDLGDPLPNLQVNITNTRTGDWNNSAVSDSSGYYRVDLNTFPGGWQIGDMINITAYHFTWMGWNETAIPEGPHLWLNLTVNHVAVPEFQDLALPILGTLCLFAVASRGRFLRKRDSR
jgi:hypothetical protein